MKIYTRILELLLQNNVLLRDYNELARFTETTSEHVKTIIETSGKFELLGDYFMFKKVNNLVKQNNQFSESVENTEDTETKKINNLVSLNSENFNEKNEFLTKNTDLGYTKDLHIMSTSSISCKNDPRVLLGTREKKEKLLSSSTRIKEVDRCLKSTSFKKEKEKKVSEKFEEFWGVYPHVSTKGASLKKWDLLTKSEKEEVMEILPSFIEYCQVATWYRKRAEFFLTKYKWRIDWVALKNEELKKNKKNISVNTSTNTEKTITYTKQKETKNKFSFDIEKVEKELNAICKPK